MVSISQSSWKKLLHSQEQIYPVFCSCSWNSTPLILHLVQTDSILHSIYCARGGRPTRPPFRLTVQENSSLLILSVKENTHLFWWGTGSQVELFISSFRHCQWILNKKFAMEWWKASTSTLMNVSAIHTRLKTDQLCNISMLFWHLTKKCGCFMFYVQCVTDDMTL